MDCTTWTLTNCSKKKLDRNYTRMLCAILYKFCEQKQHSTKQQLFGLLPLISQTIQVIAKKTCGAQLVKVRFELISDALLWIPTHGHTHCWPTSKDTHTSALCDDGRNREDLPGAMIDRDGWWERLSRNFASSSWLRWWSSYILNVPYNLSMLAFFICPPPSRAIAAQGLREQAKANRLLPR